MPNANLPTYFPEFPGLENSEYVFECTSKDGNESLYACANEFNWEGKIYFSTTLVYDIPHDSGQIPFPKYAHNIRQVANWLVESARERWGKGNFIQCPDTRKTRSI